MVGGGVGLGEDFAVKQQLLRMSLLGVKMDISDMNGIK